MAEERDSGDKTEEPSQYRLEEFRKKGQVASSKELNSILVLAGVMGTLSLSIIYVYEVIDEYLRWLYSVKHSVAFGGTVGKTIFTRTFATILECVAPIFVSSVVIGFLSQFMQIGWIFSPEVLNLKFERLNPVEGFKRIFSAKSLVEALKGILKFAIIMAITYGVMRHDVKGLISFFHLTPIQSFFFGKTIIFKLVFSIIAGLSIVAVIDYAWEKWSYQQKLKQSKKEARDELKEKEGSPEIKEKIRTIQRETAQKRMMKSVPEADVIVTNPTHISVAIKYDPNKMVAPTVVAKGADAIAMRIRKIAKEHDVPIVENVPLARAMYKTVSLGSIVPRDLYKAVAEVLAFVYKIKRRKKALG